MLEAAKQRAVDPCLEIAGQGSSRNARRKCLKGRAQIVDLRCRAVLAHPVAILELVNTVMDFRQVARQARPKRIHVHDHEQRLDLGRVRERVDGIAERSVVDETAIPVLTAIDLRPRERGREAGAGEDVPRPDLHPFVRLRVANVGVLVLATDPVVPEPGQDPGLHIDGGHGEHRRAGVERREIDMPLQGAGKQARLIDVGPGGKRPDIGPRYVEPWQAEISEVPADLARQERRRIEPQILPEICQASARVGPGVGAHDASAVYGPDRHARDHLQRDLAAVCLGFVHQSEPLRLPTRKPPARRRPAAQGRFLWVCVAGRSCSTHLARMPRDRTLQDLRGDGLITLRNGSVTVLDWDRLREAGEFDPTYLHLREAA